MNINTRNKQVLSFVVKLLYLDKNNRWHEVRCYDTAHENVHEDIFNKDGQKIRTIIYYQLDNKTGLNHAILIYQYKYADYIEVYKRYEKE